MAALANTQRPVLTLDNPSDPDLPLANEAAWWFEQHLRHAADNASAAARATGHLHFVLDLIESPFNKATRGKAARVVFYEMKTKAERLFGERALPPAIHWRAVELGLIKPAVR